MTKKIMLLALAAVSATLLALPAMASAAEYLHLNPTPKGEKTIDGIGAPVLSATGGSTVTCGSFSGSASFETGGTTGTMELTFSGHCTESIFKSTCNSTGAAAGVITTTKLPFHLVTLNGSGGTTPPGVLVTPAPPVVGGETPAFAHIECAGGLSKFTVTGNGVIGTIDQECGAVDNEATITFNATSHGQQEHKTVKGTSTEWDLLKGGETAAQTAKGKVTFGEAVELDCT